MVGMSVETIRRIENNYNNPRIDSFIDILDALGIDFDIMLMEDEGSSWDKIDDIMKEIDSKLENTEYSNLEKDIYLLGSFEDNLPQSYKIRLVQYIYFYKSIYEKTISENYKKFKFYLDKALEVAGRENFLSQTKTVNSIEGRILINLSEYYSNLGQLDESKEILDYLNEFMSSNDRNYINLLYNLARYYHMNKDYQNSLEECNKILKLISKRNDFKRIILVYYLKGLSMYKLGYDNYNDELEKSLLLCDLFLKDNLRKTIERSIKNIII